MKKMIAILWVVFAIPVFAAFQYEIVTSPYQNLQGEGYGGNYFMVRITEGSGSVYIVDKINNLSNMTGNNEVLAKNMSAYGYIDSNNQLVSGTWETTITNQYQKNQWNDLVYQTGYKLGDFSAGDEIGIWIANKKETLNGSTFSWYSDYGSYGLEKKPDAFGTILAELDFTNSSPIFFGFHGVEGNNISGQPLPGTLATLLIAGGVMGLPTLRKKYRKK